MPRKKKKKDECEGFPASPANIFLGRRCDDETDDNILARLAILFDQGELAMKTIQEAVTEVNSVKDQVDGVNTKLIAYFDKVLAAINRLEAKIAAGADAQTVVDALAPIKQVLTDASAQLDVKSAEADVTGV